MVSASFYSSGWLNVPAVVIGVIAVVVVGVVAVRGRVSGSLDLEVVASSVISTVDALGE